MIVEFWPAGLARAGYGAERLLARLTGLGFRVYEMDEVELCVRRTGPRQLLERYPLVIMGRLLLWNSVERPTPHYSPSASVES